MPRKKILSKSENLNKKNLLGIAALLTAAVILVAVYFVALKIASPDSVSPNAPASQPKAFDKKTIAPTKSNYKCTKTNCPAPDFYCADKNTCLKKTGRRQP